MPFHYKYRSRCVKAFTVVFLVVIPAGNLLLEPVAEAQAATTTPSQQNLSAKALVRTLPSSQRDVILRALKSRGNQNKLLDLRGSKEATGFFVVQGSGEEFCSPTGNCSFWLIDSTGKLLIGTIAQTFALASPGSFPDILTRMHGSAFESEKTLWRYDGNRYRMHSCTNVRFPLPEDENAPPGTPVITTIPCIDRKE